MKKYIVITTINPKSTGIEKFEQLTDWQINLVGDKKSPTIKSSGNLTFLSVDDQLDLGFELAKICPYNHYTRKNIGYLYAMQQGADIIYDTDDDNLPYDDWVFPSFAYKGQVISRPSYVNIYQYFTDAFIWPRGFPLDELQQSLSKQTIFEDELNVGVWQGLADLDPDVDAIYRLLFSTETTFKKRPPLVLTQGIYCPFNSQNTLWHSQVFPYLYLPATTSFRFTDILRGYIAQYLMWEQDFHLGFTQATVYQERNEHNLMKDFNDEIECYLNVKSIVKLLTEIKLAGDPLMDIEIVYKLLANHNYVKTKEIDLIQAWIHDYKNIASSTLLEE